MAKPHRFSDSLTKCFLVLPFSLLSCEDFIMCRMKHFVNQEPPIVCIRDFGPASGDFSIRPNSTIEICSACPCRASHPKKYERSLTVTASEIPRVLKILLNVDRKERSLTGGTGSYVVRVGCNPSTCCFKWKMYCDSRREISPLWFNKW